MRIVLITLKGLFLVTVRSRLAQLACLVIRVLCGYMTTYGYSQDEPGHLNEFYMTFIRSYSEL